MNDLHPLLANLDDLRGYLFLGLRIAACLAAAVAGWFLASPIFRALYRMVSPRKGIPGELLFWLRLASAGALATAVFLLLAHFGFGGGGGGSGWFGGGGGGSGLGSVSGGNGNGDGDGNSKNVSSNTSTGNNTSGNRSDSHPAARIEIKMVPGGEQAKYYRVIVKEPPRQDPERNMDEIKRFLKDNKPTISAVDITFDTTKDETPGFKSPAVETLDRFLNDEGIDHKIHK